jgi:organic hydroperoxide reductase OsmC/OhrA
MSMLHKEHHFAVTTTWTGNRGTGTSSYRAYGREHDISCDGKLASIPGSSSPPFRGDSARYNPEELLIASLSACHMLWFLHLCADAGIVVQEYRDEADGTMEMNADGSGQFSQVVLRPAVRLADSSRAAETPPLHERAHHLCFIARSVNFPVLCEPAFL